jgi:hypothetical protein
MAKVEILITSLVRGIYYNGDVYEGSFENDMKNGYGLYTFSNGCKFEGQFRNDRKVTGTFTYANGDKYVGEFDKEEKNGKGIYYYATGD